VATLGSIGGVATTAWAGGKLSAVRDEVRGHDAGSSSDRSRTTYGSSPSEDDSGNGVGAAVLGGLISGLFQAESTQDDAKPNGEAIHDEIRYPLYPYQSKLPGYVLRGRSGASRSLARMYAVRLALEGAYMGDHVWRSTVDLDLSIWRIALLSDMGFYLEQPLRDALYLGGTYGAFALFARPHFVWRFGIGAAYMLDGRTPGQGHREYAAGLGGTTRMDIYPVWPLVLSGRFDYGKIYRAHAMTGRGTLGVVLRGFELYGGYEIRTVGKVVMQGPVAGLRVWF